VTSAADTRPDATRAGSLPGSASAGAALKAAREAAGLSVDAVAQQLKLAQRQVQALEDDAYQQLPGRTFVRGFARNYARLVHLDPDGVLARLPGSEIAPALERPTLAPSRRSMGELPTEGEVHGPAVRWIIPLILLLIVAAAGFYEYSRQQIALRSGTSMAILPRQGAAAPAGTATSSTPLPNPISTAPAEGTVGDTASAAREAPISAAPPLRQNAAAEAEPASAPAAAANIATGTAANIATGAAANIATGAAVGAAPAAAASDSALVLAFRGASWIEVKDASGHVVLRASEAAGTTRAVAVPPPLELTLGNAPQVDVTFRGRPVDLGPYTRGDVARVTLR
jgi:cytoskeleton protein RodZ